MQSLADRMLTFISDKALMKPSEKVLLAVSGGPDSMAMAGLFLKAGIDCALAHANFGLRGHESDLDQQWVAEFACRHKLSFYTRTFNTRAHAQQFGESIQMAARSLRYNWLEEIRDKEGYMWIATGHHHDDSVETLLINLMRGTGLKGLCGIPVKNGHIIRPLLFARRQELLDWLSQNGIGYRHDSSNETLDYTRNKVRHALIRTIEEIRPGFSGQMYDFMQHMKAWNDFAGDRISRETSSLLKPAGIFGESIDISALSHNPHGALLLWRLLEAKGFQFSQCRDIIRDRENQPGGRYYSQTHVLLRDRRQFFLYPASLAVLPGPQSLGQETGKLQFGPFAFTFHTEKASDCPDSTKPFNKTRLALPESPVELAADLDKLSFPLVVRHFRAGEFMQPLGMKGRKKISDLLTDARMPRHLKEIYPVLVSANEVVWLPGIHAGESFRISGKTQHIFRARLHGFSLP